MGLEWVHDRQGCTTQGARWWVADTSGRNRCTNYEAIVNSTEHSDPSGRQDIEYKEGWRPKEVAAPPPPPPTPPPPPSGNGGGS